MLLVPPVQGCLLSKMNYEEPIHQSLTSPILWAGVPRTLLIFEGIIDVILVAIFQNIKVLSVFLLIHGIMVFFTQSDPQWLDVFLESKEFKKHYYR